MLVELSSAGIAVAVLVGVWTLYTIADITQFPYDASAWSYVGMAAPALLGIWLIVELLGVPDTQERPLLVRFMVRTMVVGPVLFTVAWLLGSLLLLVLTFTGGIVLNSTRRTRRSPNCCSTLSSPGCWRRGCARRGACRPRVRRPSGHVLA
ncbi:hypothetical protein GCM10023063_49330 [Arthrobacter methylotrophus]|uniref:hypothetical protein n=1 Tax=Arthrobacter methylotrophus TaxID=121291 RepID=UPI0031EBD502